MFQAQHFGKIYLYNFKILIQLVESISGDIYNSQYITLLIAKMWCEKISSSLKMYTVR